MPVDPKIISGIVGAALAVIFYYSPKLREWWDTFDSRNKRVLMFVFCLVAAAALALIDCRGDVGCFSANGVEVITAAFVAWGASQAAYGVIVEWHKAQAEKAKK